jgi:hypothetical protein
MNQLFPIIRRKRRSLVPTPPTPAPTGEAQPKPEADRTNATKGTNENVKRDDAKVISKDAAE